MTLYQTHADMPVPVPYGAHVMADGVQFTIVSRHAIRVWLMLFDSPDASEPDLEIELQPAIHRIGDLWHIHVSEARAGQFYLYRMEGPTTGPAAPYYDPKQWLLDPFALAVSSVPTWGSAQGLTPGKPTPNGAAFPKGVIIRPAFDWAEDRPPHIPLQDTIIYETHLRGLTTHPSSGVAAPGTYSGVIEKIPYFQDLGITAIEFLPLQEFNEMEYYIDNGQRRNLHNYWGYNSLAFFAPNARYSSSGVYGQQVFEFQKMVQELHRAGIEVFMDVVFCHSAEGGLDGPTYSMRGIDNTIYYMMDQKMVEYRNYTGCGNTLNCNHPIVRDFIIDCLRYWVLHMHVDGFRFDLASVLTRDQDGNVLPNPPAVEHIAEDPALHSVKIIAEAWDIAGAYHVGSFPNERWSEWNGDYRDDLRCFWRGDSGQLSRVASRLTGSPDLYNHDGQTPQKSINYITCHDGFTMCDLVSYAEKHNEANCEDNRDGENDNASNNYGHEGPSNDAALQKLRRRQQKNMLATLLLSRGVPMIMGGDEFSRTQNGNNNAYCQDNEISWYNWDLIEENRDLLEFVKQLIAFRKSHPTLRSTRFPDDESIKWHSPYQDAPNWKHGRIIGCEFSGAKAYTGQPEDSETVLLLMNASSDSIAFELPVPATGNWKLALATNTDQAPIDSNTLPLIARSLAVLTRPT